MGKGRGVLWGFMERCGREVRTLGQCLINHWPGHWPNGKLICKCVIFSKMPVCGPQPCLQVYILWKLVLLLCVHCLMMDLGLLCCSLCAFCLFVKK